MARKEVVIDYIKRISEENKKKGRVVEYRPNFFYCPRIDEMILMDKQVVPHAEISSIYLYLMKKRDNIYGAKLSKMSPKEREEFFLSHIEDYFVYSDDDIGYMSNSVDEENDSKVLKENRLGILRVHEDFREKGLARTLITELKSDTINNNLDIITGRITPLDRSKVSIHDLAMIYTRLGFVVPSDYIKNKNMYMNVYTNSVPKSLSYPPSYTEYKFHDKTDILVK